MVECEPTSKTKKAHLFALSKTTKETPWGYCSMDNSSEDQLLRLTKKLIQQKTSKTRLFENGADGTLPQVEKSGERSSLMTEHTSTMSRMFLTAMHHQLCLT